MALVYEPKHFAPWELIAPRIYEVCGADALYMYDPDILMFADAMRDIYGPMVCNTYGSKRMIRKYGLHRFRGLRPVDCKIGAKKSAHKVGIFKFGASPKGRPVYSGIDLWPVKANVQEIHADIKKNQIHWGQWISRIETHKPNGKPITWLHADSKPHNKPSPIHFFRP